MEGGVSQSPRPCSVAGGVAGEAEKLEVRQSGTAAAGFDDHTHKRAIVLESVAYLMP